MGILYVFAFAILFVLRLAALGSSAGKGLTSLLFCMLRILCFCHCPVWYPGSEVVLDCIVS